MVVALLVGLGIGLGMFALIAALAVPMQHWADHSGVYDGKRQAPLGKQLQLIAFICLGPGLGGGFQLAAADGPDSLTSVAYAVWAVTLAGAAVFGYRLRRSARPARPPAERVEIAHYTGAQRSLRCTLPRLMVDSGRAMAPAFVLPPAGIVLLAVGKPWFGVGSLAIGAVVWIVMLRLPARYPPRRGPCAPS